jgi:hypothetical protein
MMPLPAAMPYEDAVDIARSSEQLQERERERLVAYMVVFAPGLADRVLRWLIASEPELLATALLDLNMAPSLNLPGPDAIAIAPELRAGEIHHDRYAYDEAGQPVMIP